MNKARIPILAEILNTYYSEAELLSLAELFDISLAPNEITALGISSRLVQKADFANHGLLLDSLLSQAGIRCRRQYLSEPSGPLSYIHSELSPQILELQQEVNAAILHGEIAVPEGRPFSAKSVVREFLENAGTPIFAVDPYVGVGTLDCFRAANQPIRLLTGTHQNSVETGFDAALAAFAGEGFAIEVRKHPKLHDRHFVFNERCWLVGSSLKDAGKKAFHVTEIVDAKAEVIAALEAKWVDGTVFP